MININKSKENSTPKIFLNLDITYSCKKAKKNTPSKIFLNLVLLNLKSRINNRTPPLCDSGVGRGGLARCVGGVGGGGLTLCGGGVGRGGLALCVKRIHLVRSCTKRWRYKWSDAEIRMSYYMAGIRNDTHRRRFKKTCFGPEYSSDNAGDGPEGKDDPNMVLLPQ